MPRPCLFSAAIRHRPWRAGGGAAAVSAILSGPLAGGHRDHLVDEAGARASAAGLDGVARAVEGGFGRLPAPAATPRA
jgi:hypothetical protein